MSIEVLINAAPGETRLALVEDGRLVEYVNSRQEIQKGAHSLVGAIYLGRVANVSKALDAAFIDLGLERPGLLAFSDTKQGAPRMVEGAPVIVRVTRDATDDKGAKLTGRVDRVLPTDMKAPAVLVAAPDPVDAFLATRVQPDWRVIADAPRPGAEIRRAMSPIFSEHDVDVQLDAALQSVVPLGDGASLVIEETAALVAIDVNTGPRGAPHAVNLAAIAEIARQIRLRNLAGQILIDFLPEKGRERREQLIAALRVAVADDPCEVHVLGLTRLGLGELTRRRVGESLAVRMGYRTQAVRSAEGGALDLLRGIDEQAKSAGARKFAASISPAIDGLLKSSLRGVFEDLTRRHALQLSVTVDATLASGDFKL